MQCVFPKLDSCKENQLWIILSEFDLLLPGVVNSVDKPLPADEKFLHRIFLEIPRNMFFCVCLKIYLKLYVVCGMLAFWRKPQSCIWCWYPFEIISTIGDCSFIQCTSFFFLRPYVCVCVQIISKAHSGVYSMCTFLLFSQVNYSWENSWIYIRTTHDYGLVPSDRPQRV